MSQLKKLLVMAPLAQFHVADQFGQAVQWERFEKVPQVLVLAGKPAALEAKAWGVWLQKRFNQGFQPTSEHLHALDPAEKIKVIPVATLPDVPTPLRFLFRAGFRKESPRMGLVLDFSGSLSQNFEYRAENALPKVVVLSQGRLETSLEASPSNEKAQKDLEMLLAELLPRPEVIKPRAR